MTIRHYSRNDIMDLDSSFSALSVDNGTLKVNHFAAVICENHTEFVITIYPNYINLFITQFGKIGNLYQVRIEQPENGINAAEPVYDISPLLGSDNLEAEIAARYITERLKIRKPLLLSLSLKSFSKNTLDALVEAIRGSPK